VKKPEGSKEKRAPKNGFQRAKESSTA